jgi:hypothetical protein|tara:strand:+ start:38 stop:211 length:174 start_codon:yes stop_codon:yes gene_type:complete
MNNKNIIIFSFIILIAIVACKKGANKSTEIKNQKELNSSDDIVWQEMFGSLRLIYLM